MKTKIFSFVKNNYLGILIVGFIISQQIQNNSLKNALLESKTEQQKEIETEIVNRNKENDSIKEIVENLKNDIVLLKKSNDSLKDLRTQNQIYYAKKINDVDNATRDELSSYLSNYKYSSDTSQRD